MSGPVAACFCGAVRIPVAAALSAPINCHCGQCRALSGAAFTTWVSLPRSQCQLPDPGVVAGFKPTQNLTRWSCRRCASHVFTEDVRLADIVGIPAGAFPDAVVPPPKRDYFIHHKPGWHQQHLASIPQFGGESGYEPVDGAR
ncbi:hypothetical protein J2X20_002306 [Pelomonas saccharophila]|uniref:CENP-V/GFA domain-containing protein n=1 Tax=Roseateles saccharophilus TaxID=304 RepID=A0ABU1YLE2_ROSSA|nr:GFA family protein [Roseateles saccharophilus]MDR7269677.1 hypothetical protein [Roseateles saccharophilus]